MNIHILVDSIYSEYFVDFMKRNFGGEDSVFVTFAKYPKNLLEPSVIRVDPFRKFFEFSEVRRLFYSSKQVFLHSLFDKRALVFLLTNPGLLEKTTWIIWGGDVYNYWLESKHTMISIVHERLKEFVIRRIPRIICLVREDYEFILRKYKTKAKCCYAFYPNPVNTRILDSAVETCKRNPEEMKMREIRIMVGNSASITNHHHEVLSVLANRNLNAPFRILCPLSYGDLQYAKEVTEYGKKLFGDKFVPITEFVSPEKYVEILSSVDVAIFANRRQQALGNILALLYLGKKVYIRSDISTWGFLQRCGIKVFDYNELGNITAEELTAFDNETATQNRLRIRENFSEEKCVAAWKRIFEGNCGGE